MWKQGRKRGSSSRLARRKPSWEEGASDFDEMQKGLVVSTEEVFKLLLIRQGSGSVLRTEGSAHIRSNHSESQQW